MGTRAQLTWYDRTGKQKEAFGDITRYPDFHISPDGKKVVVVSGGRERDVWLYEVARGVKTRFTNDPRDLKLSAVWSPDGARLVFDSVRKGHRDLYQKAADETGSEELLIEPDLDKRPSCWSWDGRFLLYQVQDVPKTKTDLWVLPMLGERKPFPFLQTAADETWGQFAPDGQSVLYTSDESGRDEVYLSPFPGPGAKLRISVAGGAYAKWRRDGKEIFYLAPDNKLMAVEVNGQGMALEVKTVRTLFELPQASLVDGSYTYDVTSDGQRFLVNKVIERTGPTPITLVQNWTAGLKR